MRGKELLDFLIIILGSALYSFGIVAFLQPLEISPGGATGVAGILSYLSGLRSGMLLFLINVPLIIIGFIKLGKSLMAKTFLSTAFASFFIDLFSEYISPPTSDRIIAALAAGVFIGAGMGMIFLRGATSGGSDILAKLIGRAAPYFPIGRMLLIIDGIVILLSAAVWRNLESALYSVLSILLSTTIIDKLLYSGGGGKVAFIITQSPDKIKAPILSELGRGLSEIAISGCFSGKDKAMLICALRRNQIASLYRIIKNAEPEAFVLILTADEIFGKGFDIYSS